MKLRAMLSVLLALVAVAPAFTGAQASSVESTGMAPMPTPVLYHNIQYRFCIRLPADWGRYYIVNETWNGIVLGTQKKESGPQLRIRNRNWGGDDSWQDIPIMIFTPTQWELVEAEKLVVSAASIEPSELARTKSYVFALPPRWIGFTDAEGQDEVQALMSQRPFKAPCEPTVYANTQYDFCLLLPANWKGYKVISDEMEGTEVEKYPELIIRNPNWTEFDFWQDIPIMIFTPRQWKLVEAGDLIVSPAGVGPGDIGRNSRYVFALPPRWIGYTEAEGQGEVEAWMSQHPFQAPCARTKSSPSE